MKTLFHVFIIPAMYIIAGIIFVSNVYAVFNVNDYAGSNDLTNSGGSSSVDTPFISNVSSIDLESSDSDYVYISDASQSGLDITGDLTLETWVKFESLPSSGAVNLIAGKWREDNNTRSYRWFIYNNGGTYQLYFATSTNGSDAEQDLVNWSPEVDVWYHLSVIWDAGSECKFYVYGSQQGTTQTVTNGSISDNGSAFAIGSNNIGGTPSNFIDVKIDEFRVWSDVRTQQEIEDNYELELLGNEAGLVSYYPFDDLYEPEVTPTPTGTPTPTATPSGGDLVLSDDDREVFGNVFSIIFIFMGILLFYMGVNLAKDLYKR